jgi:hypothetical protein
MVVRGVLITAKVGHRLTDRLAEPDAQPDRLVVLRVPDHDLRAAMELDTEIEQDARLVAQHAWARCVERDLAGALGQQCLRVFHAILTVPHDASRPNVPPHPRVGIYASGHLWAINRRRQQACLS